MGGWGTDSGGTVWFYMRYAGESEHLRETSMGLWYRDSLVDRLEKVPGKGERLRQVRFFFPIQQTRRRRKVENARDQSCPKCPLYHFGQSPRLKLGVRVWVEL